MTDRSLRGPHPSGPLAEDLCVTLDGTADVNFRVVKIAPGIARQFDVGDRFAGELLVKEQRKDGWK